jgi:cytoskeletal protein CcmA (bactofilin family)
MKLIKWGNLPVRHLWSRGSIIKLWRGRKSKETPAEADKLPEFVADLDQSFRMWLVSRESSIKTIPREIAFEGTLSLSGYFSATLRSESGTLLVTPTGEIDGDIAVEHAIVEGSVRGDISAQGSIELGAAARVIGDIEMPTLKIQPGAIFEGQCTFLSNTSAARAKDAA